MVILANIKKTFAENSHNTSDTIALDEVSVTFGGAKIIGVLGASGAGKTTLLRAAAGLLEIDSGEIQRDPDTETVYITEQGSFFRDLTAQQHAALFTDLFPGFDDDKYKRMCKTFQLPMGIRAKNLSRGQQSMLEVALGFSKDGNLFLVDEPFLGIDFFAKKKFLQLMIEELLDDQTIVLTTHQIKEVQDLLDYAYLMKDGKIMREIDLIQTRVDLCDAMEDIYLTQR